MLELTIKQRQYLRGLAHNLNPVVMLGNNGVTEALIKEINTALNAHELIKIKMQPLEREERTQIANQIASLTNVYLVQVLGKLIIIYRPSKKAKINLD